MTETAGYTCCSSVKDRQGNSVGGVNPCARLQLRDVPDFNLNTKCEPPVGEIYIQGNCVFKGYFKDPESTKEVLDE